MGKSRIRRVLCLGHQRRDTVLRLVPAAGHRLLQASGRTHRDLKAAVFSDEHVGCFAAPAKTALFCERSYLQCMLRSACNGNIRHDQARVHMEHSRMHGAHAKAVASPVVESIRTSSGLARRREAKHLVVVNMA